VNRATPITHCQHCGAAIEGLDAQWCCAGCETAASIIRGAGLDRYYTERTAAAPRPGAPLPDAFAHLPTEPDGDARVARLALDGLRCASCVWVAEKVLERTPGVLDATVSYGTGRARVRFDPTRVDVAEIAARIAALGYRPRPSGAIVDGGVDRDLLLRLGWLRSARPT
jgi:Cu2+-exporting ATPase